MKIIRNNIIPFPGFTAINLFGVLFVRKNARVTDTVINHERIHTAQQREMLFVLFYMWYVLEWLIRLIQYWDTYKAYRNISFEREAYAWQSWWYYLSSRKHYAWWQFIRKGGAQ